MTTTTLTETAQAAAPKARGWFASAEGWLDDKGKGAWIAAMVLGFVFFWPVGLAVLFYMLVTNRFASDTYRNHRSGRTAMRRTGIAPSGNSAFDAYREDTLRRLEEEQLAFQSFLQRLRDARDKAEFDQFMDERASELKEARSTREDDLDPGDDLDEAPKKDT
ncbi:MAG: DUF2852 domain-containing protein [Pseudomonadota bacterium]